METQWAQRVDDWATWTSGRGIASLSSALLQLAAARRWCTSRRGAISFALSHERTESALQTEPLLPSTPPLFPPSTFPLSSPPVRLHHPAVTVILGATCSPTNGSKSEISTIFKGLV